MQLYKYTYYKITSFHNNIKYYILKYKIFVNNSYSLYDFLLHQPWTPILRASEPLNT